MDDTYPANLDTRSRADTAATTEFPAGIYHYHSAQTNYLNSAFYVSDQEVTMDTKGTFTF